MVGLTVDRSFHGIAVDSRSVVLTVSRSYVLTPGRTFFRSADGWFDGLIRFHSETVVWRHDRYNGPNVGPTVGLAVGIIRTKGGRSGGWGGRGGGAVGRFHGLNPFVLTAPYKGALNLAKIAEKNSGTNGLKLWSLPSFRIMINIIHHHIMI